MLNRRNFLKKAVLASGTAMAVKPIKALSSRHQTSSDYFGVHEFIENHPEAVFIMKTNVDVKTNFEAKVNAGLDFSRSVFIPKAEDEGGVPLTHTIALKPNITWAQQQNPDATMEGCHSIVTDPEFMEGLVEGMKELGLSANQFHARDKWAEGQLEFIGYQSLMDRTGISVSSSGDDVWVEIPDSVWFKRALYFWPINAPDTFLINVSKFKAHTMGITGCAKNLQGSMKPDYVSHCSVFGKTMDMNIANVVPDAFLTIQEYYDRHLADGIPRWDRVGTNTGKDGRDMETWCHRCIDNNLATKTGLHVMEGIYGRDGQFVYGPGEDGLATDFMTNIIIFGKNAFHIDNVAHWLGGHEPGNFGLFHIAIERGLSNYLNPMDIPVYEWKADGTAVLTPLTDFERTPLMTIYLPLDDDPRYHMVDEPFEYPAATFVTTTKPHTFVLYQNRPNPFNPSTSIEYSIPRSGHARLEVYNMSGQLIDVLVDGYTGKGSHMAVFNTQNHASGTYFYRFRFGGFSETKKMVLLK